MQHSQTLARVGQESFEAQKLPGGTSEERRQRDAELNRLKIEGLKAEGELQRQMDDAHQDRVVKLMELQKREMEEIQNKTSGLFHTLFTKPQEFGKQLAGTLHEAALKPITEGLEAWSRARADLSIDISLRRAGRGRRRFQGDLRRR